MRRITINTEFQVLKQNKKAKPSMMKNQNTDSAQGLPLVGNEISQILRR
jgi:hypothetical protein